MTAMLWKQCWACVCVWVAVVCVGGLGQGLERWGGVMSL